MNWNLEHCIKYSKDAANLFKDIANLFKDDPVRSFIFYDCYKGPVL